MAGVIGAAIGFGFGWLLYIVVLKSFERQLAAAEPAVRAGLEKGRGRVRWMLLFNIAMSGVVGYSVGQQVSF